MRAKSTILVTLTWICISLVACGGSVSPSPHPGVQPEEAPQAAEPGSEYLFEVTMHPQESRELPVKGTSFLSPGSLPKLPHPPEADRGAACSGSGYYLTGGSYSDDHPHNNVVRLGDEDESAEFTPAWEVSTPNGMAFALYNWNLRGFTGLQTVGFTWEEGTEPDVQVEYWVGLGNISEDRWDWYLGPVDDVLTIDSFGPYRDAGGEMLMMLLFLNGDPVVLESMEAGIPETRATGETDDLPGELPEYPLLGVAGSLPAAVDLSGDCAPINDQMTWGSCTAFAVGDGAFNYELNRVYGSLGWDMGNDKYLVSPKYLYITSGVKYGHPWGPGFGRWTEEVIRTLRFDGVSTELNAPYDLVYEENWGAAAVADAEVLSCDAWTEVPCNTWEGIATVKAVLAVQQKPLAMRAYLDDSFFNYTGVGEWYPVYMPTSGHAMCIVGYDDTRGSNGAFKVRNSWGEYWGDAGHVWITYEAFLLSATSIRTWTVDEAYSPAVIERFGLTPVGTQPPVNVEAADGTSSQGIEVSWWEQPGISSFHIYRDEMTNHVGSVAGTETAWLDTSVTDNFGHIYWVKADGSALSIPDVGYLATMPEVLSVEPREGTEGDSITFTLGGTGSGPMSYSWDFGGGAMPNSSDDSRPEVTLGLPGTYHASVTAENNLGTDTFEFDLVVNGILPQVNYILGKSGYSGDTTTLSAECSGTPQTYLWDFGTGATPAGSTAAMPEVQLGNPGIHAASLTVSNEAGSDVYHFELAVLDPADTAWSSYGHDVRRSAQSPVTGPQSANIKWRYISGIPSEHSDPGIRSLIVLADDSIVVATDTYQHGASLRRLNADGTCAWLRQEVGHPAYYGSMFIGADSGNLYTIYNASVQNIDVSDGEVHWSYEHETYGAEPLFEGPGGLLYITLAGKYLSAVNTADGTVAMEPLELTNKYNSIRQAILAPNGMMFISAEAWSGNRFVVFDTITGTPAGSGWAMYTINSMTISADGRTLFYADEDGRTVAMDTTTCQRLWDQSDTRGRAAVVGLRADGTLYVLNRLGILHTLNPETGEILWEYDLEYDTDSPVTLAIGGDGTVYCGGPGRLVHAIRDGTLVWASPEPGADSIYGKTVIGPDGTLYCGASNGWLTAVGPGSGEEFLPPNVTAVSPTEGDKGAVETFSATVLGNGPITYAWDFDGGAVPNTSSDQEPVVTLGDSGIYTGSLRVESPYGHFDASFSFEVLPAPLSWDIHVVNSFADCDELGLASVGGRLAITTVDASVKDMYYLYPTVDVPTQTSDWVVCRIEDNTDVVTPRGGSLIEFNGKPVAFYREWDGMKCAMATTATPTSESDWTVNWMTDRLQLSGFYSRPAVIDSKLAVLHGATDWDDVTGRYAIVSYANVAEPAGETDWTHTVAGDSVNFRAGVLDSAGYPAFLSYGSDQCFFNWTNMQKPLSSLDWSKHSLSGDEDLIRFGESSTIELIDGRLAATFSRNANAVYGLWYGRASVTQPDETSDWTTHLVTDEPPYGMGKLGTINGRPAILYRTADPWVPRIAVAKSTEPATANDWDRSDVDPAAKINGSLWELIEVNGVAYIVFEDNNTTELKVAVYDY